MSLSSLQDQFVRLFRNVWTGVQSLQDLQVAADFEREFRGQYSNFSMDSFLHTGMVPPQHSITALRTACLTMAERCQSYADRCHSTSDISKWTKCAAMFDNPILLADFDNALKDHEFKRPSRVSSGPKSTARPVSAKPSTSAPPTRDQLLALAERSKWAGLVHSECKVQNCRSCRIIFCKQYLTKCSRQHRGQECDPSGWYPHVSNDLWKILRPGHRHHDFWFKVGDKREYQQPNPLDDYVPSAIVPAETVVKEKKPESVPVPSVPDDYTPTSPTYDPSTSWSEEVEINIPDTEDEDDSTPLVARLAISGSRKRPSQEKEAAVPLVKQPARRPVAMPTID